MLGQVALTKKELIWIFVVFWSVVFTAVEAPYSFTFETRLQTWQLWTDALFTILFSFDLVKNVRQHLSEMKKADDQVRRHIYPDNRFLFGLSVLVDFLATIPFDIIFYLIGLTHFNHALKLIRLCRLVRIVKLFHILEQFTVVPKVVKMQFILVFSMVLVHWIACLWLLVQPMEGSTQAQQYITSVYWTITTLTTIGYGDITPATIPAKLFTMVIMILGVGVYGVVIGNISRMFAESDRYQEKTREKFNDLSMFMKHYNIPKKLQQSVFSYYQHIFNQRLSDNDTKIISELPQTLQEEIQLYMNIKMIRALPIFKFCSIPCLKEVAQALEKNSLSPGDYAIKAGDIGHEMFILAHGAVDIILGDGQVVASLQEGQFFGEAALLKETTRNADVRAQSYCDLYQLNKDDFLNIIKSYPELLHSLEDVANKRQKDKS